MSIPEPLIAPADAEIGREHMYTVAFLEDVKSGYTISYSAYRDSDGRWYSLTPRNSGLEPIVKPMLATDDDLVVIAKIDHLPGTMPPR